MNWLKKLLRDPQKKPHQPVAASLRAVPETKALIDPQQLRQRLALARSGDEREQLEAGLGAALAEVRQAPLPDDSLRVKINAVIHLSDKTSALAWLADLTDDASLTEVALHAHFAEVRLAAARRLASTAALERVAQASRGKDKGVYRHCSNTLQERQLASDCTVRAAALEGELAIMLDSDPVSAARLVDLDKEYKQLSGIDLGRCSALIEQVRARVQEQARHLQLLHARHQAAQSLAAELMRQAVLSETELQQLRERWRELSCPGDAWPAWLASHRDLSALQHHLSEIEARLMEADADLEHMRRCEAFLETHGQDEALDEEAIAVWESLSKPVNLRQRAELQSRWEACLCRVAKRHAALAPPPPPAAPPPHDHTQLKQLIVQLEAAIDQGHLVDANKLETAIEHAETASALPHALARRVARARAQLLKLRGWARWGGDQVRQQLILKAEQAAQESDDIDALSKTIAQLRQEWKALDVHGAAPRALWERFDAAAEKAYAPVAAHRAELAARQEAARVAKEALCQEWENWLAEIHWEHADIKVIQTMRQKICETWRTAAAARAREERVLRQRFETLLAGLDANIDAARRLEVGRCEALIAAAEALREHANLRQAIDSIKALQQRWRDEAGSVRLARAEQTRLWQKFRGACDAVFARREDAKAQQMAQRAQCAEEVQTRLEALQATLNGNDIAKVHQALAEFRALWREAKLGAMTASARDALQRAEARLQSLQASKRRAPYQLMAQKMVLVEQIEGAAAQGVVVEALLQETQAAWQSLPRLPEKFEQPLTRRLAAAPGATVASLAEGRKLREEMLLDMEIALDLRSPDAHDESRRARQLQLLQQKFRKDQLPPVDLDQLIVSWHATAAVADREQQQRMARILQTLSETVSQ
ncbi:MAG: DUF349 domain-containing protein [Sterolibacterium sp.]